MTIQDLGSIGEVLAAVATIATLIYLARQLRANTAAVQGDSRRAHRAATSAANLAIASDPNVAALLSAGLRDFRALAPEQHVQFAFLMAEMIGAWDSAHQEFESGIVDERQIEMLGLSHLPFLRAPGGREWWGKYRNSFRPSFREFLDAQLDGSGGGPPSGAPSQEEINIAAAEAQVRAYNSKEDGWFERFFADEVVYDTYGPWTPQGLSSDRARLREMAMGAMRLFPDRTMTVKSLVAEGDTVVLETVWAGTAAEGHPSLQPGERMVLRNILFNRYSDGKIVETREYGVQIAE